MRAVKFIKPATKTGALVKGMAVGAVVDATVFDPHEARLSDLLQQYPALRNPITAYLVVHAENYVTVRFVRKHSSSLATLEREPPFQRVTALTCAFSLCSLVTERPAWTTSLGPHRQHCRRPV